MSALQKSALVLASLAIAGSSLAQSIEIEFLDNHSALATGLTPNSTVVWSVVLRVYRAPSWTEVQKIREVRLSDGAGLPYSPTASRTVRLRHGPAELHSPEDAGALEAPSEAPAMAVGGGALGVLSSSDLMQEAEALREERPAVARSCRAPGREPGPATSAGSRDAGARLEPQPRAPFRSWLRVRCCRPCLHQQVGVPA